MNINIEEETKKNTDFRRVIYTDEYQQVVLMSINQRDHIPLEVHDNSSQFIRVEEGEGIIRLGKNEDKFINIKDGSAVTIKYGTYHHIINTGRYPLKLYTIYTPPVHPEKTIQKENPDTEDKLSKINLDEMMTIAMNLGYDDIMSLCSSNSKINEKICRNNRLWLQKLELEYPEYKYQKFDMPPREIYKFYIEKPVGVFIKGSHGLSEFLSRIDYGPKNKEIHDLLGGGLWNNFVEKKVLRMILYIYMANKKLFFQEGGELYIKPNEEMLKFFEFDGSSFNNFMQYIHDKYIIGKLSNVEEEYLRDDRVKEYLQLQYDEIKKIFREQKI